MISRMLSSPLTRRWVVLLKRLGILQWFNLIVRGRKLGRELRIPLQRGVGLEWLVDVEAWADPVYKALLQTVDGVFVDVGVNLGQSLVRLRLLDPERPYVGFEPNPRCVAYTERLLRLNDLGTARIIPAALSDADGEAELLFTRDDPADPSATIIPGYKGSAAILSRHRVQVRSFRSVEAGQPIGPIGILKIDVEGAESEVLRSMRQRLVNDRPVILIEILPTGVPFLPTRLQRQQEIESLFAELGYRLHRIRSKPGDLRLEAMHAPIEVHDDQDLSNFIVLPAEKEARLLPILHEAIRQL